MPADISQAQTACRLHQIPPAARRSAACASSALGASRRKFGVLAFSAACPFLATYAQGPHLPSEHVRGAFVPRNSSAPKARQSAPPLPPVTGPALRALEMSKQDFRRHARPPAMHASGAARRPGRITAAQPMRQIFMGADL